MGKQSKRQRAAGDAAAATKKHKPAQDEEEGEDVDVATLGFDDALSVGLAFQQLESHDSAKEAFARAVALQPAHFGARTRLADVCAEAGEYGDAVVHYQAAAASDEGKGDASLWLRLGMALAATDAVDEAIDSYKIAASIAEPEANDSDDARRTYGMALAATANALGMEKGDVAGAVKVYAIAVKRFPANANLHYNLATMQLASDDKRAAVASLKRAIELDGDVLEFYEELMGCLDDKKELAKYTQRLDELRRAQPAAGDGSGGDEETKENDEDEEDDDDEEEGSEDEE